MQLYVEYSNCYIFVALNLGKYKMDDDLKILNVYKPVTVTLRFCQLLSACNGLTEVFIV
jgi:hypothetical protein